MANSAQARKRARQATLARALATCLDAVVLSTDDVRASMVEDGTITGLPGTLGAGLYRPENIVAVYDAVLRQADHTLSRGYSVILDGTWSDPRQRDRVRALAARTCAPLIELVCAAPLSEAVTRIESRGTTTSQVTPQVASELMAGDHWGPGQWPQAHRITTTAPPAEVLAGALDICRHSQPVP